MTHADTATPRPRRRMRNRILLGILLVAMVGLKTNLTVVDETERAAVFFFGDPVRNLDEPGVYLTPFWQTVTVMDNRYRLYDSNPSEIITADKKTVVTDDFTLWRIGDPTKFIQAVGTPASALKRIDDDVFSQLRRSFGARNYEDIVVNDREAIIATVTDRAGRTLATISIDVAMVLTNRVELPPENKQAVYTRMSAERLQQAQQYRSEGEAARCTESSVTFFNAIPGGNLFRRFFYTKPLTLGVFLVL